MARYGTTRTLPSGRVQARYTLATGEQVTLGTFTDLDAARAALLQAQAAQGRGDALDSRKGRITFAEYMQVYMQYRASKGDLRPRTLTQYEWVNRSYLVPAFGRMPLDSITPEHVDRWYESQPRTSTRRNAYALLSKSLRYAVKWGHIRQSPCLVESGFADTSTPRPTFTAADVRAVFAQIPGAYLPAFRVMFAGHLRLGEMLALNWADFDRKAGALSVTKQRHAGGRTAETKTGQHRTVALLADGLAAIDTLAPGIGDAPLLTGPKGGRVDRMTLSRVWEAARAEAGLPTFRIHDLRHVGLTLVAQSGASLREVQQRGGHSTVAAAMRYQHATTERDAEVARRVDALLA